jgi:HNH endonuclease
MPPELGGSFFPFVASSQSDDETIRTSGPKPYFADNTGYYDTVALTSRRTSNMIEIMKFPQNEEAIYKAVERGDLEIRNDGTIYRLRSQGKPCAARRAEWSDKEGYLMLSLWLNGRYVHAMAHRLVWLRFRGSIPPDMTVNHDNGITDDNRPENLSLMTNRE